MLRLTVKEKEWETVKYYSNNLPNGGKLSFKNSNYSLTHSFIKINDEIYCLARKNDDVHIPQGSVNKVKYAQNRSGALFVMKSGKNPYDNSCLEAEFKLTYDLNYSLGAVKRVDKLKYYFVMPYVGLNLEQFFKENSGITDEERLEIAIKLCWQVYRLHSGLASKSFTPYAHLDLKPDNVTLDESHDVHIIDYGLAETSPKSEKIHRTHAYYYKTYQEQKQVITGEQYDITALKRILFMPNSIYSSCGFITDIHDDDLTCILTSDLLTQTHLHDYINTEAKKGFPPDASQNHLSALDLCALLIAAKMKLNVSYEEILHNQLMALAITGLYCHGRSQDIDQVLKNAAWMKYCAGLNLIARPDWLEKYESLEEDDPILFYILYQVEDYEAVRALLYLKQNNLEAYYSKVIESHDLISVILTLAEQNLFKYINKVLDNPTLAAVIAYLKDHEFQFLYLSVITNPLLCHVIANISEDISEEKSTVLESLLKLKCLSDEEMIGVCQNEKILKACYILASNTFFSLNYEHVKTLLKQPESVDVVIHLGGLNDNSYLTYLIFLMMLKSPLVCKAIKILIEKGIASNDDLNRLIINPETVDLILRLNSSHSQLFYQRILKDVLFRIDIKTILDFDFANQITVDMLEDKSNQKALSQLSNSFERFQGFLEIYNRGLQLPKSNTVLLSFYETIVLLKKHGLENYIETVVNYPDISYHVYHLLLNESNTNIFYHLENILKELPIKNRFTFIQDFVTNTDQIKTLFKNKQNWHEIKMLVDDGDKIKLQKLIYDEDALAAKSSLKMIKQVIKETKWSPWFFEGTGSRGEAFKDIPQTLLPHVNVLQSTSEHRISPVEGLSIIKQYGRDEARRRQQSYSAYFFKSNVDNYFSHFNTEESFSLLQLPFLP